MKIFCSRRRAGKFKAETYKMSDLKALAFDDDPFGQQIQSGQFKKRNYRRFKWKDVLNYVTEGYLLQSLTFICFHRVVNRGNY